MKNWRRKPCNRDRSCTAQLIDLEIPFRRETSKGMSHRYFDETFSEQLQLSLDEDDIMQLNGNNTFAAQCSVQYVAPIPFCISASTRIGVSPRGGRGGHSLCGDRDREGEKNNAQVAQDWAFPPLPLLFAVSRMHDAIFCCRIYTRLGASTGNVTWRETAFASFSCFYVVTLLDTSQILQLLHPMLYSAVSPSLPHKAAWWMYISSRRTVAAEVKCHGKW